MFIFDELGVHWKKAHGWSSSGTFFCHLGFFSVGVQELIGWACDVLDM